METKVNYSIVGAFVISLIAIIVLAIIWLSSGFSYQHYSTYMIYMRESVSGLTPDSPVEFNGVNVGTVTTIQLNHKNPELVELILKVQSTTPITQGTTATLTTRGVTGITYVALKDKSTDLRPLVVVGNQPYPVIKTAPSFFMRIDTALNQLSHNLQSVTQTIQSVLDKENQQSIKDILINLNTVTTTLSANSHKMDTILDNTSRASREFGPLLQSGVTTLRSLQSQTLPEAYQLMANLNQITQNLTEASAAIKQNPAVLIRGSVPTTFGPGETR